jgi:hypothetical protein
VPSRVERGEIMKYVYAPKHTVEQYMEKATEHEGHKLYVDFTNGLGWHKHQHITVETRMDGQILVSNAYGKWWYPVSDLWAYGTPQCITCS